MRRGWGCGVWFGGKNPSDTDSKHRDGDREIRENAAMTKANSSTAKTVKLKKVKDPTGGQVTSTGNELRDIFRRYDRDGSGSISRREFARMLEAMGQDLSEAELDVALDVVDANHSGLISWAEFRDWWNSR